MKMIQKLRLQKFMHTETIISLVAVFVLAAKTEAQTARPMITAGGHHAISLKSEGTVIAEI